MLPLFASPRLPRCLRHALVLLTSSVAALSAADQIAWQAFNDFTNFASPQRLIRDGQGGLYAYFQPVDIAGGQYTGYLSRLRESTGGVDPSFRFEVPHSGVGSVAVRSNGQVYVAYSQGDYATITRVSATGQIDPSFRAPRWSRGIRFLTLQPDGKILVAVTEGLFANPPADALPGSVAVYRLLVDGRLDPSFTPTAVTGSFGAIIFAPPLPLSDGGIIIAGTFGQVGGINRPNLAKLNPDGTLNLAWAGLSTVTPLVTNQVRGAYEQAGGAVVAVGDFRLGQGGALPSAADAVGAVRFTPAGTIDPTYANPRIFVEMGITGGARPRALVTRSDGGAVVVSDRLIALNPDGTVDPAFTRTPFSAETFWLERGSDGRLYVPDTRQVGGQPTNGMSVFAADGTGAANFGPGGFGNSLFPTRPVRLGNGDLVVAGSFNRFAGGSAPNALRVTAAGEPSATAAPNLAALLPGDVTANFATVAPGPDGSFYALTGGFNPSNQYTTALGRFLPSGERDTSWTTSLSSADLTGYGGLLPYADGGVYLIGTASAQAIVSGSLRTLLKVTPNGEPDPSFQVDPQILGAFGRVTRRSSDNVLERIEIGTLAPLAIDSFNRVLLLVVTIDGSTRLLRMWPNGQMDASFSSPSFGQTTGSTSFPVVFDPVSNQNVQPLVGAVFYTASLVTGATILPDGSIIVTGRFRTVGGFPRPQVARLNADGSLRLDFPRGAGPELRALPGAGPAVLAATVDSRGRLVLGGRFDTYDGHPAPGLIRLRPDGSVDPLDAPGVSVPLGGNNAIGLLAVGDQVVAAGRVRPTAASGLRPAAVLAEPPAAAPTFVAVPASVSVFVGEPATLTGVLSAAEPPSYQWFRGVSGDRSQPVAGGFEASLEVSTSVAGTFPYWLEASAGGLAIASPTAFVTASLGRSGFLAANELPSDTDLTSDPDGDGVSVLEAYAFGTPGSSGSSSPALVQIPETGEQVVVLDFPRRREAVDIRYIVESSTDLVTWTEVGSVIIVDNGGDNDAAASQAAVPLSAGLAGAYLRIRAVVIQGG